MLKRSHDSGPNISTFLSSVFISHSLYLHEWSVIWVAKIIKWQHFTSVVGQHAAILPAPYFVSAYGRITAGPGTKNRSIHTFSKVHLGILERIGWKNTRTDHSALPFSPYLYPRVFMVEDLVFFQNTTASIIKVDANLKTKKEVLVRGQLVKLYGEESIWRVKKLGYWGRLN